MRYLAEPRAHLPVGTGNQLRPIPVEQPHRNRPGAHGGWKPQVVGGGEQPRRPLELRLRGEEPAWQARVSDAVRRQAVLEKACGYRSGAHALAKPGIVRTGRVGNRDESAERCPPSLVMKPSVPRRAARIDGRDRFHPSHHLVDDRRREPFQRCGELVLARRRVDLVHADIAQQPALILQGEEGDKVWLLGRGEPEKQDLPPPLG